MKIYAIRDVVVGEYMPQLYLFQNHDVAKRWFEQAKAKADYPTDLQLFHVADIDMATGVVSVEYSPLFIM